MQPHNLTRAEARERSAILSDLSYEIALDLTKGDEVFGSETTLRFRCSEPGAETFVDLFAPRVHAMTLNGRALGADAFDGKGIRLSNLEAENELRVSADCQYQHTGSGMHFFRDPVDDNVYLHTQFEPRDAHRVFTCFDQPDLKAVFDISVLAPPEWQVASNGTPAVKDEGNAKRWTFSQTPKASTYITAVVAGPYHIVRDEHNDIELSIWTRQSLAKYLDAEEIFEITKQGFTFFEKAFDYPYVWGKYDQLFVPEFSSGAMENAGCVTFNEMYIFRSAVTEAARESRASTILHEMAHMWFGDLVTMRWWDDLWLNESFATFMGTHAQVNATRFTNAWTTFTKQDKTWAYSQDQLPSTHPIMADVPDVEVGILNFDGISYAKGASVLRQLVAWVGEDEFMQGCRTYFKRYEFGNAELTEFLACLEEASGRDLQAWAKEWLQTAGVNSLRPDIATDGETITSLAVTQEAPGEWPTIRSHRVAVGLYDAKGDEVVLRRRVESDVVGIRTEIPELAGEAVPDLLLVNDGDLAYARIRLDERSFATLTERLRDIADPLTRALCWTAAWDMTRDAELPARAYVALALNNIGTESDIGVLQSTLNQARSATVVYGDPARRREALVEFAARALEELRAAKPGSDRQIAWSRNFLAAARSDEHLALVRRLLDGTETIDGLPVDFAFRWACVHALTGAAAADESLIDAELERDPTDEGRRNAAAARSGMPDPAAKQRAWDEALGGSLPLKLMAATLSGIQDYEQPELSEPFRAAYFEALPDVWASRDPDVARAWANAAFPRSLVDEATLAMTDAYLKERSPAPPLRRILLEARDTTARAIRARACDANAGS